MSASAIHLEVCGNHGSKPFEFGRASSSLPSRPDPLLIRCSHGEKIVRVPPGGLLLASDGFRGRLLGSIARLLYRKPTSASAGCVFARSR
jgi:hypothetical protein